jgi:hypothetical protein
MPVGVLHSGRTVEGDEGESAADAQKEGHAAPQQTAKNITMCHALHIA